MRLPAKVADVRFAYYPHAAAVRSDRETFNGPRAGPTD